MVRSPTENHSILKEQGITNTIHRPTCWERPFRPLWGLAEGSIAHKTSCFGTKASSSFFLHTHPLPWPPTSNGPDLYTFFNTRFNQRDTHLTWQLQFFLNEAATSIHILYLLRLQKNQSFMWTTPEKSFTTTYNDKKLQSCMTNEFHRK